MFAHLRGCGSERDIGSEARQHPLEPFGITEMLQAGSTAKWAEFSAATAQSENLFLNRNGPIRSKPFYFFLMCLMAEGFSC